MRLRDPRSFTADERSFRNAKLHAAFLISYKAFADLASKSALLVITIVAARRLAPQAFGVFALGSTVGWIVAVTTDFPPAEIVEGAALSCIARAPSRGGRRMLRRCSRCGCVRGCGPLRSQ